MDNAAEQVLANWIELALSPSGKLPENMSPARWVAERFLHWWRKDFEGQLDDWLRDAEMALACIREELNRQGGWDKFGEALHECTHLSEALEGIRQTLFPAKQ